MAKIGKWPEYIHSDYEQVKRIEAGSKLVKKIKEVSFDKETDSFVSATIQGSAKEPYVLTLNECSCSDYAFRFLPCKHIYALAFKLGLLDDLPKFKGLSAAFDPAQEIERYKQLYLDGDISADAYAKIGTALGKLIK